MSASPRPKILILGDFCYSRAQGAHFALGLAKPLKDAGFTPEFLAAFVDETGVRSDFHEFACHFPLKCPPQRSWRAALNSLLARENGILKWLEKSAPEEFHTIIVYPGWGSTVAFLLKLQRLCRAKSSRLVANVVEWQNFSRYDDTKFHNRLLAVVDVTIQMRYANRRIKNVIAISSFLERYYKNVGANVIRFPNLVDVRAEKWNCRPITNQTKPDLTLLFSGAWSRDRLDVLVDAVARLRRNGKRVILEFLGCSLDQLGKNPSLKKRIVEAPKGAFRFHGWVPFDKVLSIAASADFGVMLRDRTRWSDACFPSKVVEFQALGIPILSNLTSDLNEVLVDGENALVVPDVSVEAVMSTINRAIALTPAERDRLRQGSLQCAASKFDYRIYTDRLGEFIRRLEPPAG